MKGLCVYVDGGKGHYVPAVTVKAELEKLGCEAYLEELFDFLDIRWLGKINKFFWRLMLKHSKFENKVSSHNDHSKGMELAIRFGIRHCMRCFKSSLEENPVDFIFCTHPYASTVLSEMLVHENIPIPVYYFATDVFTAPLAAICDKLRKFYIATKEGAEAVLAMGQKRETVEICPFPLRQDIAFSPSYTKQEARRRIGLDENLFTIQFNLGGEGLGSLDVISAIADLGVELQVVVIGGMDGKMKRKLEMLACRMGKNVHIIVVGFVNNVNEYLYASDLIVGRAGINTLVEAFYVRRPFLITELVYTVMPSADYVVSHKVGWNCNRNKKLQIEVLKRCLTDKQYFSSIEKNFDLIPIEFDAAKLARMMLSDVDEYREEIGCVGQY